jgi:hypothetical protein
METITQNESIKAIEENLKDLFSLHKEIQDKDVEIYAFQKQIDSYELKYNNSHAELTAQKEKLKTLNENQPSFLTKIFKRDYKSQLEAQEKLVQKLESQHQKILTVDHKPIPELRNQCTRTQFKKDPLLLRTKDHQQELQSNIKAALKSGQGDELLALNNQMASKFDGSFKKELGTFLNQNEELKSGLSESEQKTLSKLKDTYDKPMKTLRERSVSQATSQSRGVKV